MSSSSFPLEPCPEWAYDMRRECQEIIPNLYLGPASAAKDGLKLQSMGITHKVKENDDDY